MTRQPPSETPFGLDEPTRAWLRDFEEKHGRPLRVLHVGNIANNAYLNAKLLRSVGIDAQVLCYDYYHVMACPEWEDADFDGDPVDDYAPNWKQARLGAYKRPDWFVSAPLYVCRRYLKARHQGHRARFWSRIVSIWRSPTPRGLFRIAADLTRALLPPRHQRGRTIAQLLFRTLRQIWRSRLLRPFRNTDLHRTRLPTPLLTGAKWLSTKSQPVLNDTELKTLRELIARFDEAFPDRPDRLTVEDMFAYMIDIDAFREIFSLYDLVQCYSTDPIYALLAGTTPYIAYEHGTLRDFTLEDQPVHRLTALAYRESSHAFITNGDCLAYAKKLGIPRYSAMIHPVDVDQHEADFGAEPARVKRELGADLLLLCPIRHDWSIKGTDVHLRALPLIKQRFQGRVVLLLAEWGEDVPKSKALIHELGCEDDVRWLRPLPRHRLILFSKAADVLLDQMALPHFGATAPQGLATGTPVVMSYEPESTAWIVDEPAPLLPAFTPEEVAAAVEQAIDPAWRADFAAKARAWVYRQHHPSRIIREHCRVYRGILEGKRD